MNMHRSSISIGDRVMLVKPVDNYPTVLCDRGETGTLASIGTDGDYWVRLDANHPDLAEWQNCLQIWDWSDDEGPDGHPSSYLTRI